MTYEKVKIIMKADFYAFQKVKIPLLKLDLYSFNLFTPKFSP